MISAIVSAYFAEEYLGGRIDNLLSQIPQPQVVAVCQEGGVEHRLLTTFGGSVKVVVTAGIPTIYQAWNLGIKASEGDFITNANSDDRLYPGALRELQKALVNNGNVALAYGDTDIVASIDGPPVNRFEWAEGDLRQLLEACFVGPMPMWRRSLHEKYGFFDEEMRTAGDYEFWLRLAYHEEQFLHLKRVLGAFLARKTSASEREPLRSLWESSRARSRYSTKE